MCAGPAAARLEGVNRPELLPKGANVPVIDVAGFLTASEVGGTDVWGSIGGGFVKFFWGGGDMRRSQQSG
mgnify:CR=1 FL=1